MKLIIQKSAPLLALNRIVEHLPYFGERFLFVFYTEKSLPPSPDCITGTKGVAVHNGPPFFLKVVWSILTHREL